jgi:hypothetical protein
MSYAELRERFDTHGYRHPGVSWEGIEKLVTPELHEVIAYLEESGGEPDVVEYNGTLVIADFSTESPGGRRALCYDEKARSSRKRNAPESSVELEIANHRGSTNLRLVDEELYLHMQSLDDLDTKTSSWLATEQAVRDNGEAIFGDKRFGRTFIYHNGADSYYSARGFRACVSL